MKKINTIIRTSKRDNPYVMIDKYGLNDERLSWKAKGLLAYLLSKPDDWQVYESDLIKRATDGRDAVRTGLRELEKFGYLSRRQIRGGNGSFGHMEYIVYERPIIQGITEDGKTVYGENEPSTENPSTENPSTENPLLLNNDCTNNDLNMIDCLRASSEIAAAIDPIENEIYNALKKYIPQNVYVANNVPANEEYINEIFFMLTNQFSNQLDPKIIEIASKRYFDCTASFTLNGVILNIDVKNPTGLFKKCYQEAIQLYKVKQNVARQ